MIALTIIKGKIMKKNRFLSILLCLSMSLTCGCGGGKSSESSEPDDTVLPEYLVGSSLKYTQGGRPYLEVEGEPFLYTGVQIRADGYTQLDSRNIDEMEEQFRLASELGVKCVEVPVSWNELEPEEDVYYFRKFKNYLEWCYKYNLKLEVLWFSYNSGQSLEMYTPSYIFDDEVRFPQHPSDVKGQVWGPEGRVTFFKMNSPELLNRERKAIAELTDYIYEWEIEKGNPNVVISYQVHNETDNYPRWNIKARGIKEMDGSGELSHQTAWEEIYESLNSAGMAFKTSKYRAVTRCNLVRLGVSGDEWKTFAVNIFNLDGIDMVGDDTYTTSVEEQKTAMNNLFGEEYGYKNFAHVAENSGNFPNSPTLLLSAITQGAGYLMYCLSMPLYWVREDPTEANYWEQGVLDVNWNDKKHTQRVREIYKGLNKAAYPLAYLERNVISSFNADTDNPSDRHSQDYSINGVNFTVETENGALGYCFLYLDDVYTFVDENATVSFNGKTIGGAEIGRFDGSRFLSDGSAAYSADKMDLSGKSLYKIELL